MASADMHETTAPASVESRRQHDTGFPEPFNGVSNTTLPHPEADLSPNAFISQDDLTAGKIGKRRSIRHRHKRTISHGRITPQMEAKYHIDPLLEEDEDAPDSMMDGTDGLRSRSGSSIHPMAPVMSISTGRPSTSRDGDSVFSHGAGDSSPTMSEGSHRPSFMRRKLRFLQ
ncbi:predicted protein [Verticillium alfalfae VaMs.102]|uniref:Predicted protein n=1 Tax=Verticillium alfalfae (strain VaMs.102 / ATCC MYA-4576 / FGSC 10136) TaxID=526221 RepID=C9S5T6_VERA1|nr:predicted protein [Verticillium alfalfae VaMs.102]EEY14312.1 predicted protein [Verticillium alfalfae VaMs.102]